MGDLMHTIEEAAALLGLSRTTVYQEVRADRLRSVKVGRSRRIPHQYLVDYVERLMADESRRAKGSGR